MDQTERDRLENSAAGQAGNNVGMAAGIFLPGPGGKVGVLQKAVQKLGLTVVKGSKGVAVGNGGRNGAVKLFNQLRGTNSVTRRGPGLYTAPSSTGNGIVTFRFPSRSQSNMWSVDTPKYVEGVKKFHF